MGLLAQYEADKIIEELLKIEWKQAVIRSPDVCREALKTQFCAEHTMVGAAILIIYVAEYVEVTKDIELALDYMSELDQAFDAVAPALTQPVCLMLAQIKEQCSVVGPEYALEAQALRERAKET